MSWGRRVVGVGYPRVIGDYVAGYYPGVGADAPHSLPVHPAPHPAAHSAPWRPMMAPGSPPLGEGHVPMPLNPEEFALSSGGGAVWGNPAGGGGAPPGTIITFSARPQKPFKTSRLIVRKSGPNIVGAAVVGQTFVGTDLQQAELGFVDIETIGAGGSFDTWISLKQAEPGVWIRIQATLTAFPLSTTGTDFVVVTVSALGHYLH